MNIKILEKKLENMEDAVFHYGLNKISSSSDISIWTEIKKVVKGITLNQKSKNIYIDSNKVEKSLNEKIDKELFWTIFLRELSFQANKYDLKTKKGEELKFYIYTYPNNKKLIGYLLSILETEFWVRSLQEMPPNILKPTSFASQVIKRYKKYPSLKVSVLKGKDLSLNKLNLLKAVNAGSSDSAAFVVVEYRPIREKDICLIGKGITFDSGGYTLKNNSSLRGMKMDMSGAAIIFGVMELIAKNKIKKNIVSICPLTDNLIGQNAFHPQYVIETLSGETVEITNTDAEGRLVLADSISYANKHYKPTLILDVATLTGSNMHSLENYSSALFSNSLFLTKEYLKVQKKTGERTWHMPIYPEVYERLKNSSAIADIANSDHGTYSRSSYAAAFLMFFAKKTPLIHLDVGGTAVIDRKRGCATQMQSIFEFIKDFKAKERHE